MPPSRFAKKGTDRLTGTVTGWNPPRVGKKNSEGFGFVVIDGKEQNKATDLFLYADSVVDSKLRSQAKIFGLKQGTRVSFVIEEPITRHESGRAVDVRPAGESDEARGSGRQPRRRSRSSPRRRSRSSPRRRSPSRRRSSSKRRSQSGRPRKREASRSASGSGGRSCSRRRSHSR